MSENNKNKKIEVIPGKGKNLNISPVYNHINAEKIKKTKKEDILIPKTKK